MKIILPMAGKGTRLRPHTLMRPKPLMKVAGKTMLEHLLDKFSGLKISEIIFIINPHQENKISELVRKNYKYKIRFVEQTIADGTAGAIKLARPFVDEDILICYVDTLFDADLSIIRKVQKDKNTSGIMWAKEVENYQRFGVLMTDISGNITKIVEKPTEPVSKLANIGIYYIKEYNKMFEGIDYLYNNNIMLNNEYFIVHAFQYMIDRGSKIKVAPVSGWYDCGTLPDLLDTNKILLKTSHRILSKTTNSVIIPPVYIDKNVVIENSIIGPDVSVASGCVIRNSIIQNSILDHDSKLSDVKLKDSTFGENVTLTGGYKKLNLGDYSEMHFE